PRWLVRLRRWAPLRRSTMRASILSRWTVRTVSEPCGLPLDLMLTAMRQQDRQQYDSGERHETQASTGGRERHERPLLVLPPVGLGDGQGVVWLGSVRTPRPVSRF